MSYCQLCVCTTDETLQRLIIDPQTEVGSAANVGVWGAIIWLVVFNFEVIVWVKLQRETNQCGARTDSEAPSANNSGRMPKL